MALKNQEDISDFGKRLYLMMERYNENVDETEQIKSQTSHTQKSHEAPKVGQKLNKKIA